MGSRQEIRLGCLHLYQVCNTSTETNIPCYANFSTKNSGDTYYGYWSTGAQNGRGTHYFREGGKFEGEWQQGLPVESAVGILTMTDGKKNECLWNEIPTLLPATARYLPSITPVTLPSKPSTSQRILGALYPRNSLKVANANVARNNSGIWSRPMYLPHAMLLH